MAEANKLAWGNHVVAKFIIKKPYGTKGNCYPTETIVFSTAIIRYSKGTEIKSKRFRRVYRNRPNDNHAEKQFIKDLEDKLQQSEVSVNKIIVNLVQNYSPCRSICVKKIIDFKTKMEAQNIESSWTIKFANFYEIYYEPGKEKWKGSSEIFGLVDLLENGVTLQLLGGEQDWEEFLNKYVDPIVKTRGLQLARSRGRKQREKHDTEIFAYINTRVSGKQKTTKLKRENRYWPASSINIALDGT
jgi:hypothetical protein